MKEEIEKILKQNCGKCEEKSKNSESSIAEDMYYKTCIKNKENCEKKYDNAKKCIDDLKKGEPETENSVGTLDETKPLSYTCIKTPEQGELWYRQKYPDLPEDFYGIIARYTWGQPQTKKSIRNEVKKIKKNPKKPIPQGLTVLKGKFSVTFD